MTITSYWAEHAVLPTGPGERVRLTVIDGRFSALVTDVAPEPDDVRLPGVVLPGLANAHSHAFHRALRGRTHGDGGTFWTWREQMYAVARTLDPDRYLALARAAYAEMALAGFTVVGEFHYVHHDRDGRPYADPNAMGHALVEAAAQAGVRLTLLDTCYLAGGLTRDGHQPLDPVQRRFTDHDVDGWAARVDALRPSSTVRLGASAHSVRAVPAADLARLAAVLDQQRRDQPDHDQPDHDQARPLHVHLSEQPAENAATQGFYGCSPTELLHRAGLLGARTTAVHATHLSDHDIVLLGRARTSSCFCPTTERDLADGIGPARRLLDAGSPLCLGSDQHAVVDPFEELRGLESHERLTTQQRGRFSPVELWTAAGPAGYAALGWAGGGRLAVGAPADLIAVRDDSVRTAGSLPAQIGYSATAADVDTVVVAGELVVTGGQHRLGDVGALLVDAVSAAWEAAA